MKYPINYTAEGYGDGWAETAEQAIAEYIANAIWCGDNEASGRQYTADLGTVQVFKGQFVDCPGVFADLKRAGLEATMSAVWGGRYIVEVTTWKVVPV